MAAGKEVIIKRMTTRQKEIFTGLCVLGLTVGLLLAGEMLVRVQQIFAFGEPGAVEQMEAFYIHEATGLRLPVPGGKMGKIRFNSLGFRGPELDDAEGDDTILIAFLGSSITFDAYVYPDEKTWPAVTSMKLAENYTDCRFMYQNAGVPGLGSQRLLEFFNALVAPMHPDIVVVMTDDRSVTLDKLVVESRFHDGTHYRASTLAKYSRFWAKVEKNVVIEKRKRLAHSSEGKFDFTREQLLANYEEDLRQLLRSIREQGAIPVLLSFGQKVREYQSAAEQTAAVNTALFYLPYISVEGFLRSARWYNEKNLEIASRDDVHYIEWHRRVPGEDAYFSDTRHFTAIGSALLGEVLGDELNKSPEFAGKMAQRFDCAR